MDSYLDKVSQRKNAQEMIAANYMAEAEEKERITAQLAEYEKIFEEIRKCSLQSLENAEKVKELLAVSMEKIEEVQREDGLKTVEEQRKLMEAQKEQIEELFAAQKTAVEEMLQASQEFDHKEAVKVYRNVQAVLEESAAKQTREITEAVTGAIKARKTSAGLKFIWILTLLAVLANVGFAVAQYLGLI